MVSPVPIPEHSASRMTTGSPLTLSISYEHQRRTSSSTFTPSPPSAPPIMLPSSNSFGSTSSSAGSSSAHPSPRIPAPRRGSSLPSSLSSSSPSPSHGLSASSASTRRRARELSLSDSIHAATGNGNGSGPISILQFISSTSTPSWAEVEASPLDMVPTFSHSTDIRDNIDMVTFLREAPGVNRTPTAAIVDESIWWSNTNTNPNALTNSDAVASRNVSLASESYFNQPRDSNVDGEMPSPSPEDDEREVVTPELKRVSLQAFLEEEASTPAPTAFQTTTRDVRSISSPSPSVLRISDIYGHGQSTVFGFCTSDDLYELDDTPNGETENGLESRKPAREAEDSTSGLDLELNVEKEKSIASVEKKKHSGSVGKAMRRAVLDALRMGRA